MKKSSQEHSQRDRSPNLYVFCRKKYVVLGLNLTKYHTFSRYRTLYTSANFDNLTKRKSTASVTRFFCGYLPRILRNGKKNFKCLLTLQVIPQSTVRRNSALWGFLQLKSELIRKAETLKIREKQTNMALFLRRKSLNNLKNDE